MVSTRAGSQAQAHAQAKASSPPSPSKETPDPRALARPTRPFSHVPTSTTLLWLAVSVPLVIWDAVYTLFRPHTMEGGWMHTPLYIPYKLYAEVDYIYGWKAFNEGNGFTSAQGLLNAVESAMYLWYLAAWCNGSVGTAGGKQEGAGARARARAMMGRSGALALLVGYCAAVMTLSKTVLYWANEYFSGFDNIGHNSTKGLILLWIIPNGLWLVFPTYMVISMTGALVDSLAGSA